MANPLDNADAVLILSATIGTLALLLGLFVAMVGRLQRRGLLQKGLIQLVFLPERRQAFLWLITLLAFFFILSGIESAFTSIGLLDLLMQTVVSAVAYVGGAICLLLLIWVSLRPAKIASERREELQRSSQQLILLAFAPAEARDGLGSQP